jgi:protein-S-isoprenylcysteine O-methyltransferase Ste14
MPVTPWEFRYRTWLILGIFCVGLACYRFDPHNFSNVAAGWLCRNVPFLSRHNQQDVVRGIFALSALVSSAGAMIRTWAGAYLCADVIQDAEVRTEKLVADGPFRYTRNPLYMGILLGTVGAGAMSSPVGMAAEIALAFVIVYRLISREETQLLEAHADAFRAYCRAVPRLLPAIRPQVPAAGARPRWREAVAPQLGWWGIAAANAIWAITLRPPLAFAVAGAGFMLFMGQKYVLKTHLRSVATR